MALSLYSTKGNSTKSHEQWEKVLLSYLKLFFINNKRVFSVLMVVHFLFLIVRIPILFYSKFKISAHEIKCKARGLVLQMPSFPYRWSTIPKYSNIS
jgi:hypothetical protein